MNCTGDAHAFTWDTNRTQQFPPQGLTCTCGEIGIEYIFDEATGYTRIVMQPTEVKIADQGS